MPTYQFQGSNIVAPITIESEEPFTEATSLSLKTARYRGGAQRWALSFRTVPGDSEVDKMMSVIRGDLTGGSMVMPQIQSAADRITVTDESINMNARSAGSSFILTAQSNQANRLIPKGYFVKMSNHNKIYVVRSDGTIGSNGVLGLEIYPNLVEDVPSGTTLQTGTLATINYHVDADTLRGIRYTDGILSDTGTIRIFERL